MCVCICVYVCMGVCVCGVCVHVCSGCVHVCSVYVSLNIGRIFLRSSISSWQSCH